MISIMTTALTAGFPVTVQKQKSPWIFETFVINFLPENYCLITKVCVNLTGFCIEKKDLYLAYVHLAVNIKYTEVWTVTVL